MFLLRGLPVADGAGVLYEYASIALADMYSTELAGVNTGWADISEGAQQEGGLKMDNTGIGSGLAPGLEYIPRTLPPT